MKKIDWADPWDNDCWDCGSHFKKAGTHGLQYDEEIAEVVRPVSPNMPDVKIHVLVHVSCMKPGEDIA